MWSALVARLRGGMIARPARSHIPTCLSTSKFVTPAKAGVQSFLATVPEKHWIPACAGMKAVEQPPRRWQRRLALALWAHSAA
jgi:hypothetical protein